MGRREMGGNTAAQAIMRAPDFKGRIKETYIFSFGLSKLVN